MMMIWMRRLVASVRMTPAGKRPMSPDEPMQLPPTPDPSPLGERELSDAELEHVVGGLERVYIHDVGVTPRANLPETG